MSVTVIDPTATTAELMNKGLQTVQSGRLTSAQIQSLQQEAALRDLEKQKIQMQLGLMNRLYPSMGGIVNPNIPGSLPTTPSMAGQVQPPQNVPSQIGSPNQPPRQYGFGPQPTGEYVDFMGVPIPKMKPDTIADQAGRIDKVQAQVSKDPFVQKYQTIAPQVESVNDMWGRYQNGGINRQTFDTAASSAFESMVNPIGTLRGPQAQQLAGGIPVLNSIIGSIQKFTQGGQSMTDADRANLVKGINIIHDVTGSQYNQRLKYFSDYAANAQGVDPKYALGQYLPAPKQADSIDYTLPEKIAQAKMASQANQNVQHPSQFRVGMKLPNGETITSFKEVMKGGNKQNG